MVLAGCEHTGGKAHEREESSELHQALPGGPWRGCRVPVRTVGLLAGLIGALLPGGCVAVGVGVLRSARGGALGAAGSSLGLCGGRRAVRAPPRPLARHAAPVWFFSWAAGESPRAGRG